MGPSAASGTDDPADSLPTSGTAQDAALAMNLFSAAVRSADTKAALLATAVAILGNSEVGQRGIATTRMPLDTVTDWVVVSLYSGAVSFFGLSIVLLILVLRPRRVGRPFSRFSWPAVARVGQTEFLEAVRQPDSESEAWLTAHALARIADVKLRAFTWALAAAVTSALLFVAVLALP